MLNIFSNMSRKILACKCILQTLLKKDSLIVSLFHLKYYPETRSAEPGSDTVEISRSASVSVHPNHVVLQ
jgi:hypothetical protein